MEEILTMTEFRSRSFSFFSHVSIGSTLLVALCGAPATLLHSDQSEDEERPHTIHLSENAIISDANNNLENTLRQNNTISTSPSGQQAISHQNSETLPMPQIDPFTGKIVGTKVRLRLNPSLDAPIIKELTPGDLWIVTGEVDEFYAVEPKEGTKGYVFRTYILDGVIEGTNVNLRLKPDTQSPVITQLSQGDSVTGNVCQENQKWFEIDLPKNVRFYIAKEYVKRIGNKALYAQLEKKQKKIATEWNSIQESVHSELEKPFHDIQLAPLANQLKSLEVSASDFPDLAQKIRNTLSYMQEEYLKLSMLAQTKPVDLSSSPVLKENRESQQEKTPHSVSEKHDASRAATTFSLEQQEAKIVSEAIASGAVQNEIEFYKQEAAKSFVIRGILVPYERMVRNRPGDFILIDPSTKVPLAYVYSTIVSLQDHIGQPVTLTVVERPNHFFALPAYYALDVSNSLSK